MIKELLDRVSVAAMVALVVVAMRLDVKIHDLQKARDARSNCGPEKSRSDARGTRSKTRSSFVPGNLTGGDRTKYWN